MRMRLSSSSSSSVRLKPPFGGLTVCSDCLGRSVGSEFREGVLVSWLVWDLPSGLDPHIFGG